MKALAAVLVELGKPLVLAELEIPVLKAGQVLVQVAFSGVCHTQLLEARGYRGEDRFLPHCLGHEGSGIVREIGPGVSKVRAGDRVIMSWIKGTGIDVAGTVYQWEGKPVNAGGITTFGCYSVVSENRLTVLVGDLSLPQAALVGCAVATGAGAVFNTARPQPGESAAIYGVGGVGLCAVAAAALAGCTPVIAIDVQAQKLELARQMGATAYILSQRGNAVDEVRQLCPGGVDLAVEASGRPEVMVQALQSTRILGGRAVVIGNARHGERVTIDPKEFNMGKRLLGTWGGDSVPDRDYPRYVKLIHAGKLGLEPMLTNVYRIDEINKALDDLEKGASVRPLIKFDE